MPEPVNPIEVLLERARAGDTAALGQLLDHYRSYLQVMTRAILSHDLRRVVDTSDVVQQTFLEACRDFAHFRGAGEPELTGWLRKVLSHNLANLVVYHHAAKRDVRRQLSLQVEIENSSRELHAALAESACSPSAEVMRREKAVLLADALQRLPTHYRDVFIQRSLQGVPFERIAAAMNRSPDAVRMIWTQAIKRLSQMMENGP